MKELVYSNIENHKKNINNRHHPESKAHDNSNMTMLDLIEMVCDWTAISQEYGNLSCKKW